MRIFEQTGKPPSEILRTYTADDLAMVDAWDRISPIGNARGDIRTAMLTAKIHNAHFENPKEVSDFIPFDLEDPDEKRRRKSLAFQATLRALAMQQQALGTDADS